MLERERLREPERLRDFVYDNLVNTGDEVLKRWQGLRRLVKGSEMTWEENRQGRLKYYSHPALGTAMVTMNIYQQELRPSSRSGRHRHPWESACMVLEGRGYSVVDGQRYDWEPYDLLSLPYNCAHQHFNPDPSRKALMMCAEPAPLAHILDAADLMEEEPAGALLGEAGAAQASGLAPHALPEPGGTLYDHLVKAAREAQERRRQGKVLLRGREVPWEENRQARVKFYLGDPSLGASTRSIRMFISELPPGGRSGTHRHWNEAALFVLEGRGYCIVNGERQDWEAGDMSIMPIGSTHQHINADPSRPARLLAMHTGPVGGLFQLLGLSEIKQVEESEDWKRLHNSP